MLNSSNKIIIEFTFILSILFYSCEKKASADFETDKTEYMAGEIVKLTNKSTSGNTFEWIMPNGEKATTKDAEYIIPFNTGFDEVSFNLTTKSKGHCIRNSKTLTVNVMPGSWWMETSTITSLSTTYVPYLITGSDDLSNYKILATFRSTSPSGAFSSLNVYFPSGSIPAAGSYTLQSSKIGLLPNTAFINLSGGAINSPNFSTDYITGQIQVEYVNNKLHVFFTDIFTSTGGFKLSADIYKP